MSDGARLHALMSEIGPLLELGEVTEFGDARSWTLVADEASVLFAELDPEDGKLWLSADVGTPSGDRGRLYELMLQYNARWQETGGVRLALDGPEGDVVMAYDLALDGLDLTRLARVVQQLLALLRSWRQMIQAPGAEAPQALDPPGLDPMAFGMIRG